MCRYRLATLILFAGAFSVSRGERFGGRQTAPPGRSERAGLPNCPTFVLDNTEWPTRDSAVVEVAGVDSASLKVLKDHDVNVDGWTSFLGVRVLLSPGGRIEELPASFGLTELMRTSSGSSRDSLCRPGMTYRAIRSRSSPHTHQPGDAAL